MVEPGHYGEVPHAAQELQGITVDDERDGLSRMKPGSQYISMYVPIAEESGDMANGFTLMKMKVIGLDG